MARTSPVRIGIFGLRGLRPDLEITGFETAFAEIAPRLASRGHAVTIFCRATAHSNARRVSREDGIDLVYMPSPGGKNLAAVISTLLSVLRALIMHRFDVWLFVNVGMGHHCALARLSRRPVVLNVDGLDWTRAKWGPIARAYFRSAARTAVRFCTALVTDAEAMRAYYREHFGRDSEMIAYGATVEDSTRSERLSEMGVTSRDYYLIVSRLIPENSLVALLEGFRNSRTKRRLIIVGGTKGETEFQLRLHALASGDERVRFAGHVHDQELLRELWCNCYAYLHGHSVGGTNPALLRAMGYGSCVLALDTVFNREVLADTGLYFESKGMSVASCIDAIDETPNEVVRLRYDARERVRIYYDWNRITDQYERLLVTLAASASR